MNSNTGGTGTLRVTVTSGEGAFPVEAALVYISGDAESGENGVIYSLRTNQSGLTEKVSLSAPPKSLSQSPAQEGEEKPFSTYNIQVMKEGYSTVENVSVPVFDGIMSLQRVNLIPEPEYSYLSPGYPDELRSVIPAPTGSGL